MVQALKILPYYTGAETLEEALSDARHHPVLWLEILFNDQIPWDAYLDRPAVRTAYDKACLWYTQYKTMIQSHTGRGPLQTRPGRPDPKEHRKFLEALNFVSAHT